jgi:hypothetical protein
MQALLQADNSSLTLPELLFVSQLVLLQFSLMLLDDQASLVLSSLQLPMKAIALLLHGG